MDPQSNSEDVGHVHHLAFSVSRATFVQIPARLEARGVPHTGAIDRGFMDSIYFRDPRWDSAAETLTYKFEPPAGYTHAQVLLEAHSLRTTRGDALSQRSWPVN